MPIETISVYLQHGRSLARSDVINHSFSSLSNIRWVVTVHQQSWNTVVLALFINIAVLGNIWSISVDGSTVVNCKDKKWEVVLRGRVQKFRHTSILGSTLPNKDNRNTIIICRWSNIHLFDVLVVGQTKFLIDQNTLGRTTSVWKLFGNQSPTSLEIICLVKNVHGSSGTLASTSFLHEQFSHDGTNVHTTGNRMSMLTVVRVFLISILNGIVDETWNTFLTVVKMHEATNFTLHVLLVAGILECPSQGHGPVEFHESFLVIFKLVIVYSELSIAVSKCLFQLVGNFWPWHINGRAHHTWLSSCLLRHSGGHAEITDHAKRLSYRRTKASDMCLLHRDSKGCCRRSRK
mmetsp:Transcript_11580/g.21085  ORF Transcript_11580/g.21085 Transcript_11580/m.21085 type:complete len:348 (-) Transcript_11580:129-1172(-)